MQNTRPVLRKILREQIEVKRRENFTLWAWIFECPLFVEYQGIVWMNCTDLAKSHAGGTCFYNVEYDINSRIDAFLTNFWSSEEVIFWAYCVKSHLLPNDDFAKSVITSFSRDGVEVGIKPNGTLFIDRSEI